MSEFWRIEPRQFGEDGLAQALNRLRLALTDGAGFLIPLSEGLAWIYSLHELHESRFGDSKAFRIQNSLTPEGQTLRAVVWARSFVAHELMAIVHLDFASSGILGMGVLGRMVLGSAGGPPIWAEDSTLVSPTVPEDDRRLRYAELVAGRQVMDPLTTSQDYLLNLP
jgi:hypothetical protein